MVEPPSQTPEDRARLVAARRHMEAVKGFYIHAAIYLIVNAGLIAINAATSSQWWAQWPIIGWGLLLAGHWVAVYRPFRLFSETWERKRVDDYMRRHKD